MKESKKNKNVIWIALAVLLVWAGPVWAEGDYQLPGQEPTEESGAPIEEVVPTEEETPKQTEAPEQTDEKSEEWEEADQDQSYTMPGKPQEVNPPTETEPTQPTESKNPSALSDAEYMEALTLAFMDGVTTLTPDRPHAHIQAVTVRVPSERIGSAQWFLNGEARGDYYSSEFPIYNGRITGMEVRVPFEKGMEDTEWTVALEVHLNGAVRRIEKKIQIDNYEDTWYETQLADMVYSQVHPVEIEATVHRWTRTYSTSSLGGANGSLEAGTRVIYCDHSGTYAARIWIPEENRGCWVPYSSIWISDEDYTIEGDLSDEVKEAFVNLKGYDSATDYLIWINLERQMVNVFQGGQGDWDLIFVSTCSTGSNITPTPTGEMTYCAYGDGWFHDTYYVKPVMYLNLDRGIAMHSILFNPNGTVQDGTQGKPVSHGCVRMPADKIRYLADHIPVGTKAVVF